MKVPKCLGKGVLKQVSRRLGDSAVIDPKGNIISQTKAHKENIETVLLNFDELNAFREKFPVGNDADDFEIRY